MIPAIGYMIGFYIITRMVEFMSRRGDRRIHGSVAAFAVVTILVTAVCLFALFSTEVSSMEGLIN